MPESSWTMPVTVTATPEAMLLDNHEWDWGVSCSWHDDDQVDVEETLGRSQVGHRRWIAGGMQRWSGGTEPKREEVAVGRPSVTGIHWVDFSYTPRTPYCILPHFCPLLLSYTP